MNRNFSNVSNMAVVDIAEARPIVPETRFGLGISMDIVPSQDDWHDALQHAHDKATDGDPARTRVDRPKGARYPSRAGTLMIIFCLFGLHQRSGRTVRDNGRAYVARCRYCDAPMIKNGFGRWVRDRDPVRANGKGSSI